MSGRAGAAMKCPDDTPLLPYGKHSLGGTGKVRRRVATLPLHQGWTSPDRATRRGGHRAAGRARERHGQRLQVRDRPVDAVARWRMRVDVGKKAFEVRPPLRTP